MSTAAAIRQVMEEPNELRPQLELVARGPQTAIGPGLGVSEAAERITDEYPLLPVVLAGGIAAAAAFVFIGAIVAWLALRQYGVIVF